MRRVIGVLGVVALILTGGSAGAQECDFLTAGGYITVPTASGGSAKANFGVGGSCKAGGDGHGLWGHLQYIDHGVDLKVHWLTITAYSFVEQGPPSKSGQPTGTRIICGTGRTNMDPDDTVDWVVKAKDSGEPGKGNDMFMITVKSQSGPFTYSSGDQPLAGGNVNLHKPNPSTTTALFSTLDATNCPAFEPAPPAFCDENIDCPSGSCNFFTSTCCPPLTSFDPISNTCVPD